MLFQKVNLVSFIRKRFQFFLLLIPCVSFSQGISNNWLTGYSGGLGGTRIDFNSGFPDTLSDPRTMNFMDCNANISDSLGNLLFYTNGIYIANANNDTMLNGQDLNPSTYTTQQSTHGLRVKQGNLILPLPSDSKKYYLFHETLFFDASVNDYRSSEIYYSIIDMSLDGGLGAVTQKNIVLLSDTLTIGAITACKHANGRDWWLVFHKSIGRRYYKYLLTPSGLQGPFAQDIGYSLPPNDWIWQSCFSPDGTKFSSVMARDSCDIMEFDRCTGLFSNDHTFAINDSAIGRGVAFSPNSHLLYVSSMSYLYQYNTLVSNFDSSKFIVANFDGFADPFAPNYSSFYLEQLAMDNKIYCVSGNGTRFMHVINTPDSSGNGCNVLQHGFSIPTFNAYTIPNFPNYFLGASNGTICDTLSFNLSDHNEELERRKEHNLIISNCKPNPLESKNDCLRMDNNYTYREFISSENVRNIALDYSGLKSSHTYNSNLSNRNGKVVSMTGILFGIKNYSRNIDFVMIDCSNDSITSLNHLSDYYYGPFFSSAFDNENMKYFFSSGQKLKILDAISGNLDTTFTFTNINPYQFSHIVYNSQDHFLYGIKNQIDNLQQTFSKLNPSTGVFVDLFTISPTIKIEFGCKASLDPLNGEYYLQGKSIVSINISTGQVLSNLTFQNPTNEWLDHFAYSCKQQKFYGLTNNYHTNVNYFSSIDSSNGITVRVNPNPLPTYFYKQYLSGSTIDNSSDTYYYSSANGEIYGIDINTGNIVYDHNYGPDFQLLFLESASSFDCLTASVDERQVDKQISVYPNPGIGIFTLDLNNTEAINCNLKIMDASMRTISIQHITQSISEIDLSLFPKGLYFYILNRNKDQVFGKIVLN